MKRRQFLMASAAAATAAASAAEIPSDLVRRHDEAVDRYLSQQIADRGHRWYGAFLDATGLPSHGGTGGAIATLGTAYVYEGSRHHGSATVLDRMKIATAFLMSHLSAEGNISLLTTNFNSAPDTAFMVLGLAPMLRLAKQKQNADVVGLVSPLLDRCGHGLSVGGVHTPNHRWVVSSALAQLYEITPKPEYLHRIDQWLAEGIDIDSDGQYTERSTSVYNTVVDRAFVVIAHKLKRPELLEPVRRNLDSLLYLVHPNDEVVTEISRRQDQYQKATFYGYWFPLQYLAVKDGNGRYAALAAKAAPHAASLPVLLEYPELNQNVAVAALPEDFEKTFPELGITRIRRGATSATLIQGGTSRVFTLRRGEAGITAVRFASAFFGKGQFVPAKATRNGNIWEFVQELSAGYYQPLEKPHHVVAGEWASTRKDRRQTETCNLRQSLTVREDKDGFTLHIKSDGTADVPLAIEIAFAPGGKFSGVQAVKGDAGAYLMSEKTGSYTVGADTIHFGPMLREHSWVAIRGGEPRIPNTECVYLTATTPVDHTIRFTF